MLLLYSESKGITGIKSLAFITSKLFTDIFRKKVKRELRVKIHWFPSSNPRVTSSDPRVRTLKARIARLKSRVWRINARVGRLKARVRRLKARV